MPSRGRANSCCSKGGSGYLPPAPGPPPRRPLLSGGAGATLSHASPPRPLAPSPLPCLVAIIPRLIVTAPPSGAPPSAPRTGRNVGLTGADTEYHSARRFSVGGSHGDARSATPPLLTQAGGLTEQAGQTSASSTPCRTFCQPARCASRSAAATVAGTFSSWAVYSRWHPGSLAASQNRVTITRTVMPLAGRAPRAVPGTPASVGRGPPPLGPLHGGGGPGASRFPRR